MGMSIDEIILKEKEIAEEFQKIADTHILSEDRSLEELYCDDTEVIEEEIKMYKELSEYHNTIANFLRKYQKIEEIYKNWCYPTYFNATDAMNKLGEVLKDGNAD